MSKSNQLPKGKYIFLWGGLIANAGGMTRAMLYRASAFQEHGVNVEIVCAARGLNQRGVIEHYKKIGYNLENVKFTFLEEYLPNWLADESKVTFQDISFSNFSHQYSQDNLTEKIYNDGLIFAIKRFDAQKTLLSVEYYDDKQKLMKTDNYHDGIKRWSIQAQYLDGNDYKFFKKHYSKNGFCYMSILNVKKANQANFTETEVFIFSQKDGSTRHFKSISDLREMFFNLIVSDYRGETIFCFDDPILDMEPGFRYMPEDGSVYKIAVNHGAGLGHPRTWNSKMNPRLITNLASPTLDALIMLTKEAMNDFSKRLGNITILYNLPNTIKIPSPPTFDRDLLKVVFVGRFSPEKQCDHIIKAFQIVVQSIEDAKLYFYGRGDSLAEMKNLINKLDLSKSVIIESFTNDPYKEYRSAALSVVTSDYEGFSLSLLESLANGCPVASYKVKYGPADVLVSGKNGYLVEKNNIEMLADKIIYHLEHPELLPQMSKEAFESIQIYDENNYMNNWITTLNKIVERRPYKNYISGIDFKLHNYVVSKSDKTIKINGTMEVVGSVPDCSIGHEKIYFRIYTIDDNDYSITDAVWTKLKTENLAFEVSCVLPIFAEKVSACIEWENSFFEYFIAL